MPHNSVRDLASSSALAQLIQGWMIKNRLPVIPGLSSSKRLPHMVAEGFPAEREGKANCKHFSSLFATFSNAPLAKES